MLKTIASGLTALIVTASSLAYARLLPPLRGAGECEAKRSRLERPYRRTNWHSQGGIAANA